MIGIIGGTGLYKLEGLESVEERRYETPFGKPSAPLKCGRLGKTAVAFLPRHGLHHEFLPSEINYRANIWALKEAGATALISVSAVGSLSAELPPGTLVIPSQYIDCTKGVRAHTFLGEGLSAHISTAEPMSALLASAVTAAGQRIGQKILGDRTYICVEGPRLGTRAESHMFRSFGAHIIGMTNVPEVFLAREAQLPYCTLAVVTDFDCWLEDPTQHVSLDLLLKQYGKSLAVVKEILVHFLKEGAPDLSVCPSRKALKESLMIDAATLSPERKRVLEFLQK